MANWVLTLVPAPFSFLFIVYNDSATPHLGGIMEGADPGGKGTGAIAGECLCALHLPSVNLIRSHTLGDTGRQTTCW